MNFLLLLGFNLIVFLPILIFLLEITNLKLTFGNLKVYNPGNRPSRNETLFLGFLGFFPLFLFFLGFFPLFLFFFGFFPLFLFFFGFFLLFLFFTIFRMVLPGTTFLPLIVKILIPFDVNLM